MGRKNIQYWHGGKHDHSLNNFCIAVHISSKIELNEDLINKDFQDSFGQLIG